MAYEEIARYLPLVTAILMYAIAAIQIFRDRFKTWTESFFVFGFFFGGTYALSDLLFFTAPTQEAALVAAKLSLSSLTLCALFFLLFMTVFLRRMKKVHLVAAVPAVLLLATVWATAVQGAHRTSWGWAATFEPWFFYFWVLYVAICVLLGVWQMRSAYGIARAMSNSLRVRTLGIMLFFVAGLAAGLGTNTYFITSRIDSVPLFSSFMALPSLATLLVVLPLTRERLVNATKSLKSKRYEIMASYLVHADGTLLASKSIITEPGVDRDIFSATLDVIQNFMRTSFPYLSGKWLKTIEHGDTRIVIERGKHTFLALVLKGEENDILRRQMKDTLATFESDNDEKLTHWRGIAQEAKGIDGILNSFFAREVFF